jgi:hypothetical protein
MALLYYFAFWSDSHTSYTSLLQVLHLAAESDALRAAVFRAAAQEVCTALVLEKRTVRPQLGVDRAFLQATAVEM